jgi:hypothetical protein
MGILDVLRRHILLPNIFIVLGVLFTETTVAEDLCKPMVVGYFDHTAAWYQRRPQFQANQTVAHTWRAEDQDAIVVLYSDIAPTAAKGKSDYGSIEEVRKRMKAREVDIANYLKTAGRNGNIRVLLQLPPELALRWVSDPETKALSREYVKRWSREPALAGFYVADEPELRGVPTRTLQDITNLIKMHAPNGRNAAAISVAYSGQKEMNPLIRAYASASPRAFDVLLVNRYPVFRKYGGFGRARTNSMSAKLGLTEEKARREGLADNEFANIHDYYDSVVTATRIPGLAGRPVYASMQAYGLRDDCDGPACKATKERNPRRSPTWSELLYLFTSVWMSGADGAVLYSHYFSLYDKALRIRLDNLEKLMSSVYRHLPGCGYAPDLGADAPQGLKAHYAGKPDVAKPELLVVMNGRRERSTVRIRFDRDLRVTRVHEQRFDSQGNPLDPVRLTVKVEADGSRGMLLTAKGFDVRIFKLGYE